LLHCVQQGSTLERLGQQRLVRANDAHLEPALSMARHEQHWAARRLFVPTGRKGYAIVGARHADIGD
jgi:hypothetical protein